MIGAPNTRGQKYWVGSVQWAPATSVSEEIADIFTNYNIDMTSVAFVQGAFFVSGVYNTYRRRDKVELYWINDIDPSVIYPWCPDKLQYSDITIWEIQLDYVRGLWKQLSVCNIYTSLSF